MHFDVFDVKECSSTGTSCRWMFHYLELKTVDHQWFFALLLLSLNFPSSATCDPCISNFDYEMMMCFLGLAHGSPAEQQFLKALANSHYFKHRKVHLLLTQRAGNIRGKAEGLWDWLEKKSKCLSARMIPASFCFQRNCKLTWTNRLSNARDHGVNKQQHKSSKEM